jgi:hypothetical protein
MTIMVGPPALMMLAAVPATSHHEQWSRVSFNISGKEGCFFSNSLKIEIARCEVRHPATYRSYH